MRRRIRRLIRLLVIILTLSFILFFLFRRRLYPVVLSLAEAQVKNATSDLINDAISEQIAAGDIQYDRIVYFEKDLNGRITALKTNMGEVNRLKTETLEITNARLLSEETSDLGVPIGSIFLPELFSGKGPAFPVRILAIQNSEATFASHFSQAGINQTLHQLNMVVSVDVVVLVMGRTDCFTVASEVVVAETVIVGDVPETFLQTGG